MVQDYGPGHNFLSNAVLAFSPKHPFIWQCMLEIAKTFVSFGNRTFVELLNAGDWGANGPKLVTRVSKEHPGLGGHSHLDTAAFFLVSPSDILEWFRVSAHTIHKPFLRISHTNHDWCDA